MTYHKYFVNPATCRFVKNVTSAGGALKITADPRLRCAQSSSTDGRLGNFVSHTLRIDNPPSRYSASRKGRVYVISKKLQFGSTTRRQLSTKTTMTAAAAATAATWNLDR